MNRPTPCKKDCPRRNSTCHSVCKDYIDWKARREQIREEIRKEKELDAVFAKMARKWADRRVD